MHVCLLSRESSADSSRHQSCLPDVVTGRYPCARADFTNSAYLGSFARAAAGDGVTDVAAGSTGAGAVGCALQAASSTTAGAAIFGPSLTV